MIIDEFWSKRIYKHKSQLDAIKFSEIIIVLFYSFLNLQTFNIDLIQVGK